MRMRFALALLVLAPFASSAEIDRAFLKELLEIPSVTADVAEANRAVDFTRDHLVRQGVRCAVETDDAGRKVLWAATAEGKTPDYVLAVHLDVVPADPDQFRVRTDGDRILARGAHDCKGNAAVACEVLRRLNGKASVGAIFASNEEMGGSTTGFLVKRGYRPRKMAIVVDSGTYGVYYEQKGNAYLTVRATGKGGHSSRALWLDSPIEKLLQGYEKFKRKWPAVPADGWGDLVVPTVVRAGQAENAIPDSAEMVLNVRSVSTDAVERVTKTLKEAAGLEVVKVRSTGKPMASDPNDPEIRRLLVERRARWPGKNASLQKMLAITDARHFAGLGVPVVIIGSIGGNAHGKDEWGDMKSMDENAESLVAFIWGNGLARSFRGVWLATVSDPRFSEDLSKKSVDGIKAHWREALDAAAKVNVNAVFFQVRPCADAFYAGSLEPWSRHLRGEQGKAPEDGFDPLRFMIDECHARGLQLHTWFNPFRVTYDEGDEKRLAENHNCFRHPEWFVKYGKSVYYDPGVPACRDWTVKVVLDVVSRYDVDGVHIDDYFYPYDIKDASGKVVPFPDDKSFARYGGGFTDVNAWRDDNSDRLVEELSRRLRELKPDVVFGVAPFNDNGYCLKYLHCDSLKWANRGWVDYLIPQLYYGESSRRQTFWWDAHAEDCVLFAGLRLMTLQKTVEKGPRKGMPELDNVLGMLSQTTNTTGVCWWPGNLMASSQSNVVSRLTPHYARKTLVPLHRHRSRTPPDAVTEVRTEVRGGRVRLTWRHPAPSAGRPKAVFTAVFRSHSANPETVTDKTEALLEGKPGELFRLVALDRLQNASEPATAGGRGGQAENTLPARTEAEPSVAVPGGEKTR